ncbi:MAG: heparinase II/III family protein, partial [Pseudomonadota bacterium]
MSASFTLSDRLKIVRLFVFDGATTAFRHISFNPLMFWRLSGPTAEELLIAPQDIQTTDPTLANEFYSGYFSFAGKTANCSGVSPFEIIPPSEAWYRELVEFGWLRHLRASRTEISRVQARVHVDDWIRLDSKPTSRAWNVESTATRVISWLCHSPLLLEGCEHPFYRRFMKSLTRQERYLRLMYKDAPPGLPRLKAAIALSYASVCIAGYDNQVKSAGKRLSRELENQVLPDGGHISRNPEAIIRILALLLPLRQAILTRNFVPEQALIDAVDRMMPMLRFFRMGDGNFAHFNGMGDTPADLIATMLAYDDTAASPVLNAPHSGYQRFQINDTTMVMDTGALPPEGVSSDAHAGCLSFELSCGRDRVVVNCGRPGHRVVGNEGTVWLQLARSTALHSTLSINDQSSCRFLESERLDRTRG